MSTPETEVSISKPISSRIARADSSRFAGDTSIRDDAVAQRLLGYWLACDLVKTLELPEQVVQVVAVKCKQVRRYGSLGTTRAWSYSHLMTPFLQA